MKNGGIFMYQIEKIIQDWCNECNSVIMTKEDYTEKIIHVISNRLGIMIGRHGDLINKYKEKIEELGWSIKLWEVNEIHYPGDNWEDIIDKRVQAYFEMEYTI